MPADIAKELAELPPLPAAARPAELPKPPEPHPPPTK